MRRSGKSRHTLSGWAPVGLMPVAAFAVHQLRYYLAFGPRASAVLAHTGHSYLHSVVPWIALVAALVLGAFLRALGRAFAGERSLSRYSVSFLGLWLACATALVALFVAQETLEGLFALGHPPGLAGVFGYGGWWAVPAAACVGLVLAALFHGARWVLNEVVERRWRRSRDRRRRAPATPVTFEWVVPLPRPALADGWSRRGPPRRSS